jgi:hypothetical protein
MARKKVADRAPHIEKTRKRPGRRQYPKKKPGQSKGPKKHHPDDQTKRRVLAFRMIEVPPDSIAKILGISTPTLYDAYPMEMEYGSALVDSDILANLHKQLTTDDVRVVPGAMAYVRSRIKGFQPAPTSGGSGHFGGGQVREMRFVIVNDPEEGLEEYRQEGQTVEVKGHDPNAPPSNIDPDPKEPGEV